MNRTENIHFPLYVRHALHIFKILLDEGSVTWESMLSCHAPVEIRTLTEEGGDVPSDLLRATVTLYFEESYAFTITFEKPKQHPTDANFQEPSDWVPKSATLKSDKGERKLTGDIEYFLGNTDA